METTMGKNVVAATIENIHDLMAAEEGSRTPESVRRIQVVDALVDTAARMLSLPLSQIKALGLRRFDTREALTSSGRKSFDLYSAVRLTIEGRQCVLDVAALPDECPVVIGYIPLEQLDFVVDPIQQKVVGNPAHHGKFMIDMM